MNTAVAKKTNGKGTSADLKVVSENKVNLLKVVETPLKEEIKPSVEIPKQEPVLSIEQKIEKIENLKTLIEKREKLEASRKKLNSFVVGSNQFSENLVLTDENGNSFTTSNTEVFTKVVDTIKETLVSKIAEIEKQIEF